MAAVRAPLRAEATAFYLHAVSISVEEFATACEATRKVIPSLVAWHVDLLL